MRLETTEGATLVDYELPDHTDKPRKLSVLQGDDPMILTLNRGFYCPKDRMQLLELARFSKQCAPMLATLTGKPFFRGQVAVRAEARRVDCLVFRRDRGLPLLSRNQLGRCREATHSPT